MTKEDIINLIKSTTEANIGVPLGEQKFYECTPVKKSDWYGKLWLKWSDAVKEAGYEPNTFLNKEIQKDDILKEIASITLELQKFPTEGELKFFHNNKKSIPSTTVIREKFGKKLGLAKALLDYCENRNGQKNVIPFCENVISNSPTKSSPKSVKSRETTLGKVYLMKSGKYYKIGKADHVGQRHYSIGLILPEKLEIIHEIATDDPFGIEKYWHNRFREKRLEGEWFDLSKDDIEAFKRRKKFM